MTEPKLTVTYDQVASVAKELVDSGEKTTVAAIKKKLGNRGSYPTISRFLKQWRHNQSSGQVSSADSGVKVIAADDSSPKSAKESSPTQESAPIQKTPSAQEASSGEARGPRRSSKIRRKSSDVRRKKPNQSDGRSRHDNYKHHHASASDYTSHEPATPIERMSAEYGLDGLVENSEGLSENQLLVRVRKLESMIVKEQSRRECAEKMVVEVKDYADVIKDQVAQRINEANQSMDNEVARLNDEIKRLKKEADQDLKYYRELLEAANVKLMDHHQGSK